MIRKALLWLTLTVSVILAPAAAAQLKQGRWTLYPTVGDSYTTVVETESKVYSLTGGRLFHYSFDDNESYSYNAANKLSDGSQISGIYYNFDKNYLLIAYTSGNIDMLFDDGKVVNLPEIKDAILTTGHGINHISFGKDRFYVATEFGFVTYNDVRREVEESGMYGENTDFIFAMGDHLVLIRSTDMYFAPAAGRHNTFGSFTLMGKLWHLGEVYKLTDSRLAFKAQTGDSYYFYTTDIDFNEKTNKLTNTWVVPTQPGCITKDGLMLQGESNIYFLKNGDVVRTYIKEPLKGKRIFSSTDASSVWLQEAEGLAHYNLSGDEPVLLSAATRPEGFSVAAPVIMNYSLDGERLYVANIAANHQWDSPGDNYGTPSYVDIIADGDIHDAAVKNAAEYAGKYDDWITDDATGRLAGCQRIVEDPDNPAIYYVANNNAGLVVVNNGKPVYVFNKTNSPVTATWRNRTLDVNIDRHGNLWMGHGYVDVDKSYSILPAERRKNILNIINTPAEQVKAYWKTPKRVFNDEKLERDTRSLVCRKSRFMLFYAGKYGTGLAMYDDNDTPATTTDDRSMHRKSFTDTEGNSLTYPYFHALTEDRDGKIWVGTDRGLFIIRDPAEFFDADFRIKRPIVARNDGTEYGDYLLDAECIYSIAVDPSNRKWIATSTSGVYLVNADGTEILEHFTSDNSLLPDDRVWSVAASPLDNTVYFGTSNGIVSYMSDSAPAAEDYSDVYAYPNPVRPDYTGWITITGLMDKSLVKIADTAGNVFFQGRSEGGIVTWDGCDPDGRRVRSGVYLVFASQNADGKSSGAVAKIMIVN